MQKKKICLVTNWYPTKDNPHQGLFFREQAIALSEYYDFLVLHYQVGTSRRTEIAEVTQINREENITEVSVRLYYSSAHKWFRKNIQRKDDYEGYLFSKVCSKLAEERIDIFYSISGQTEAALTARFAEAFNKPYVVSEHGPFPWVGTLISEENRNAIEKANIFLAISYDKIRQIMMQGIKLPKIAYVGNLVDESMFKYVPTNSSVKTFVAVGANSFYKNYGMLITVFNKLKAITNKAFKLMIVGFQTNKGYSEDSDELLSLFKESSFYSNLELIPSVPHEEMPSIYARADAFVMTSIQEGQPVSAIEAACCGLPIFSTRCGGVEDYVDEKMGRIVGLLESDEMAQSLKVYLDGELTFDNEYIRRNIISKFGRYAFVNSLVGVFNSVCKNRKE